MGFHQHVQAQALRQFPVVGQLGRGQDGDNQQDRRGAEKAGFIDLVRGNRKVLAQDRQCHCRSDFFQVAVVAEKVFRLGQAAHGRRPAGFIGPGNVQVGKIRDQESFRRGGLFTFANELQARLTQGVPKGPHRPVPLVSRLN